MKTKPVLSFLSWLLVFHGLSFPQWVKTTGPDSVRSLATASVTYGGDASRLVTLAGKRGAVYRFMDGGNWENVTNGLVRTNVFAVSINIVSVGGIYKDQYILGTDSGYVYRSDVTSPGWIQSNTGSSSHTIQAITSSSSSLFVGTSAGAFMSTGAGSSWTAVNNGLGAANVAALLISGANLYAGTSNGIFLTTNSGTSWSAVNSGLSNLNIHALLILGANLFAGTDSGIFLSANGGGNWTATNFSKVRVFSLYASGSNILAGSENGIHLSANSGATWTNVSTGLVSGAVRAISANFVGNVQNLFAATDEGIWRRPVTEMATSIALTPKRNAHWIFIGLKEVSFALITHSRVSLEVFGPSGRYIKTLYEGELSGGSHKLLLDSSELPSGLYFYRLRTKEFTATRVIFIPK